MILHSRLQSGIPAVSLEAQADNLLLHPLTMKRHRNLGVSSDVQVEAKWARAKAQAAAQDRHAAMEHQHQYPHRVHPDTEAVMKAPGEARVMTKAHLTMMMDHPHRAVMMHHLGSVVGNGRLANKDAVMKL
jgi:hypothetical protein